MNLILQRARAYVYSGMWVADCPRGCGGVERLFDPRTNTRRTLFHCSYCRYTTADIEWSADEAEIMAVLSLRPVPHTRNWYPSGHGTAIRFRVEHGQSVAALRAENEAHGVPAYEEGR